jgi:hypothetical protein
LVRGPKLTAWNPKHQGRLLSIEAKGHWVKMVSKE